jgi:hypothetical protein
MTSTGRRSTSTRHAGAWAAIRSTSPSGPVPPVTAHRTGPVNLEAVAVPFLRQPVYCEPARPCHWRDRLVGRGRDSDPVTGFEPRSKPGHRWIDLCGPSGDWRSDPCEQIDRGAPLRRFGMDQPSSACGLPLAACYGPAVCGR